MIANPPLVPPIKCQGIKTKLVGEIQRILTGQQYSRWIEPFCGSCAVPLNVQPRKALLADSNIHIIRLYKDIQNGALAPVQIRDFLTEEGEKLSDIGADHYYFIRDRFNDNPTSLDFLFLNRACFNGIMRFNKSGKFNVPYCHNNDRFARSYVTKIVNQVRCISEAIKTHEWGFFASKFQDTLDNACPNDIVYADPPYAGRHVDYFNSWTEQDEAELAARLKKLPCKFILSTWHSNEFRTNHLVEKTWIQPTFHVIKLDHFYHVGPSEDRRHPMIEALITNFPVIERKTSHRAQHRRL
jgi:DNA adenine methylase